MQEKHGSGGFLVGLLIGGAVGALVSTQRGRQILKDLADYGLEYIGKTIDMNGIETILNEDEEEMMSGEMDADPVSDTSVSEPKKEEHAKRRLFRGIRKK